MTLKVSLNLIFLLVHHFYLANSLECLLCDSSVNSTCQMGTEFSSSCSQSCYEEYIQYSGRSPVYRRGCAQSDRCVTSAQPSIHGDALKYCRTCQEDKCNNKAMGSEGSLKCIKCDGPACQMGTEEFSINCSQACYEEYIHYSGQSPVYRRGCDLSNRCVTSATSSVHGDALKYCRTCLFDKCNNKAIGSEGTLKCITCDGSANSPCQKGTEEFSTTCPYDCYEEYIHYPRQSPVYRRGCGLSDRCVTSATSSIHGDALKYCRTCPWDKCNNKEMELATPLECLQCTGSIWSDCESGNVRNTVTCSQEQDECHADLIVNEGQPPYYRRGCSAPNFCQEQRKIHGDFAISCSTCKGKRCNNRPIQTLEEAQFRRSGQAASLVAAAG